MGSHRYREKTLQQTATAWMRQHWKYLELASDEEATGDRMDSIGLLDGTLIAIEVKPVIHGGMVRHREDRSGSLEAKVAATLRGLYRGHKGQQLDIMRSYWDGRAPITIGILFSQYTRRGLDELLAMLSQRSREWCFGFRVMRWTGAEVTIIATENASASIPARTLTRIEVPELIGRQRRLPLPSIESLVEFAHETGVGAIFSHLHKSCTGCGLHPTRLRSGVSYKLPRNAGGAAIIGVYLEQSARGRGLNVGVDIGFLGIADGALPGVPAPRAGFLNTNRYLCTKDEVDQLLTSVAAVIASRPTVSE